MTLEIKGLTKFFGGVCAVNTLDFQVNEGELFGLIGPNGSGKTTVFNLITGFIKPNKGKVLFNEEDITNLKPHAIAKRGIVRTFQDNNFFPEFTVMENLIAGNYLSPRVHFWESLFHSTEYQYKETQAFNMAFDIMKFIGLAGEKDTKARNLSHGHKRMLAFGIAMSCKPKFLLLDEPLSGMNAEEVTAMEKLIYKAHNQKDITIILIEHNMKSLMKLCTRIVALNFGRKIGEGRPDDIKANDEVIEAYLGVKK